MPDAIFRADAPPHIAGGHVTRCLALAKTLIDSGLHCTMAVNPEAVETVPALRDSGCELLEVAPHGTAAGLAGRSGAFHRAADLLVADHYGLDAGFESAACDWAHDILVIDDAAERKHDCDILLYQTLGRTRDKYAMLGAGRGACRARSRRSSAGRARAPGVPGAELT